MCGIVGLIRDASAAAAALEHDVRAMCDALAFRGPDGDGFWTNDRVGLGMARLEIVGSETRGRQPITDQTGRQLVFNGELYEPETTMQRLGARLEPGESDGVALLRLLAERGVDGLRGVSAMFALALFDPADGSVLLARDAWGQKPLYVSRTDAGWAFASTIAALRRATGPLRIRPEAMQEALIFKSVGGNGSAFHDVEQIPAGGWMRIHPGGRVTRGRWYEVPPPRDGDAHPREVEAVLTGAIRVRCPDRFRASVFLSGGLDSSIVAAVASGEPTKPHVLTVGYDVGGWEDEHRLAVRLADELGLARTSHLVGGTDVMELLRDTAVALEDPVHDPVVVPTLALTRLAAQETKVVLTGDGSDEFWGGYARFDDVPDDLDAYLERTMVFRPGELGLDRAPPSYLDGIAVPGHGSMAPLDRMMRVEVANRMRNYHLSRIDKLSMRAGLEVRSPFLDLAVTSLAERLTVERKRPGGKPKGLLIEAFRGRLPRWLIERKKQPFTVPIRRWLAGPLHEPARDLLGAGNAFVRAFADPAPFLEADADTLDAGAAMRLWSLLHLEIWHREFGATMENDA